MKLNDYTYETKDFSMLITALTVIDWKSPVRVHFWQMNGPVDRLHSSLPEVSAGSRKLVKPLAEDLFDDVTRDLELLKAHPHIKDYYLGLYLLYWVKGVHIDPQTFEPRVASPILRYSKYSA